jgi:hypothetical protein
MEIIHLSIFLRKDGCKTENYLLLLNFKLPELFVVCRILSQGRSMEFRLAKFAQCVPFFAQLEGKTP